MHPDRNESQEPLLCTFTVSTDTVNTNVHSGVTKIASSTTASPLSSSDVAYSELSDASKPNDKPLQPFYDRPHRQSSVNLPLRTGTVVFDDPTTASAAAFHADREFYNTSFKSASIVGSYQKTMAASKAAGSCVHDRSIYMTSPSAVMLPSTLSISPRHPAYHRAGMFQSNAVTSSPPSETADAVGSDNITIPKPTAHRHSIFLETSASQPRSIAYSGLQGQSASFPNLTAISNPSHTSSHNRLDARLDCHSQFERENMVSERQPENGLNYDTIAAAFDRQSSSASSKYATSRFMFFSETTGVVRAPTFDEINLNKFDRPVKDILEDGPFWLDVCQPTPTEMFNISRAFGIHPLTDEDIQTPDTREKYWINYALIDDITDSFIPLIKFIELEVDNIDELVLILKESEQSDMLRRIGHARKQVTQLLRLLSTKADVVKMVINRCMERLAPDSETRLYLEDIHDHVITMMQNLLHSEKTLGRSHSNYLAQISIEITQASNRTSDVVMRMTALASILVPLNVVTGLWGMNVQVPGQEVDGPVDLRWFFMILAGMTILAAFIFYIMRKVKLV
ncbi:hypothetical protein BDEG_21663 [Batrachochytrium dendrobatidis JEL423]|uniref:Magnesium transporter n=1 Tax=Batrachochytrium dendrobatidis (strain JEL423) TaxID=403673 RepID=A0A177WDA2_BATDL|nr:hypothetical protein BDEG_21663 [Batrachochytrium dendrobatidis JEL423]